MELDVVGDIVILVNGGEEFVEMILIVGMEKVR